MDVCMLAAIIIIVVILLIIVIVIGLWKMLQPEQIGVGAPNPYVAPGPPAVAPGTHKTYVPPEGTDAIVGAPSPLPCPRCGTIGAFDPPRRSFYCPNCRSWY
jgi:hypothetical protein